MGATEEHAYVFLRETQDLHEEIAADAFDRFTRQARDLFFGLGRPVVNGATAMVHLEREQGMDVSEGRRQKAEGRSGFA